MSDEYIRREDAVDAVKHAWAKGIEPSQYIESLEPADVVQVVRCDDCVYYGSRRWCELHSSVFDDNAFCSYGERREE
jgi:hypothetical protein